MVWFPSINGSNIAVRNCPTVMTAYPPDIGWYRFGNIYLSKRAFAARMDPKSGV